MAKRDQFYWHQGTMCDAAMGWYPIFPLHWFEIFMVRSLPLTIIILSIQLEKLQFLATRHALLYILKHSNYTFQLKFENSLALLDRLTYNKQIHVSNSMHWDCSCLAILKIWTKKIPSLFYISNALSFFRSQNVLGWSKFFVPDQKFIYILWQSQTFFARQKDDLHSVKLVFVPAQKFLKRH